MLSHSTSLMDESEDVAPSAVTTELNKKISAVIQAGLWQTFDELPTDKEELQNHVQEILKAIGKTLSSSNAFYFFQEYIHNPKVVLKEFATAEYAHLTVGHFQMLILNFIEDQLSAAAKKINCSLEEIGWDSMSANMQLMFTENFHKPFLAEKTRQDDVMPNYFLNTENRIFDGTVIPGAQGVTLKVDINVPDSKHSCIKTETLTLAGLKFFPDNAEGRRQQDAYVDGLATSEDTFQKAENAAAKLILAYLKKNQIISESTVSASTTITKSLLTFRPYFNLVANKEVHLEELNAIKINFQIKTKKDIGPYAVLTRSHILETVTDRQSFMRAKSYSFVESTILQDPTYSNQLKDGTLIFDRDLKGISEEEAANLRFTPGLNLYKLNRITFSGLKHLSPAVKNLLKEKIFFDAIRNGQLEFEQIAEISLTASNSMLNPRLLLLIEARILTPLHAFNLLGKQRKLLSDPAFNKLIMEKTISLRDALTLSDETVNFIHQNPILEQMLLEKTFKIADILPHSKNFWSRYFIKRIAAVLNGLPYSANGIADTLQTLAEQIAAVGDQLMTENFTDEVVEMLLARIKTKITAQTNLNDEHCPGIYKNIFIIIEATEKRVKESKDDTDANYHVKALQEIIGLAKQVKSSISDTLASEPSSKRSKQPTFFTEHSAASTEKGIKQFCEELCALHVFATNAEEFDNVQRTKLSFSLGKRKFC